MSKTRSSTDLIGQIRWLGDLGSHHTMQQRMRDNEQRSRFEEAMGRTPVTYWEDLRDITGLTAPAAYGEWMADVNNGLIGAPASGIGVCACGEQTWRSDECVHCAETRIFAKGGRL